MGGGRMYGRLCHTLGGGVIPWETESYLGRRSHTLGGGIIPREMDHTFGGGVMNGDGDILWRRTHTV